MAAHKNQYISPAKWEAIKHEYVTTDISMRELVKKYKVSLAAIRNHSQKEEWYKLKMEHEAQIDVAVAHRYHSEVIQASAETAVRNITKLGKATELALDKVTSALESCDPTKEKDKQVLRSLVAALKDIREMQGEKSPLDIQEQQARIAKLKRETEEQAAEPVTIIIEGADAYAD